MSTANPLHENLPSQTGVLPGDAMPVTLPISIQQYADLVDHGHFEGRVGQIELINGRIIRTNPQGPEHADPIDILSEWCIEQAERQFRIRVEKPIVLPSSISVPEPDIAWVKRRSYARQHPGPEDIFLLIEASLTIARFDANEKCEIYARDGVPEYWHINVPRREIRVYRDPQAGTYRTLSTHTADESISPICLPAAVLPIAMLFEDASPL
ncbi:Uma2 family endonuclease [Neorhodopirellula pilleata]|uniref:Putative restriction endonuclease domain-containing protein n=1 Tax=Neorhodopirellula pilleata TaxID=2714738 RepID=A0A5C5ZKT8_9BACT|nr:Uma2 family endonuclease [Neorhodopirellula pilleata]TWT88034.1 hypothetical protein Pla100_57650 [Neorhodopirellula pilleata]